MKETLARIKINVEKRKIIGLSILQSLRFRCKRCATFCCRLGGPKLSGKDIERIKRADYCEKDFLEPTQDSYFAGSTVIRSSMKSKEDGSCVFLGFDVKGNHYKCLIYDFRPTLCRFYPFNFKRTSFGSIVLEVIPCCGGLKNPEGELVDKEFVNKHLLYVLLEAMELS